MGRQAPKALVVEDVRIWRETVSALLLEAGFQVRSATNLEEGLAALGEGPFHLAVVDVSLQPGERNDRSGLALVREGWSRGRIAHIVILCGFADEEEVRAELGIDIPCQVIDKAYLRSSGFETLLSQVIGETGSDEPSP